MCDQQVVYAVSQVILDYVSQKKLFTAYDVTCKVRELVGPNINVPHREVRILVHETMNSVSDWGRSLQDIGAPSHAYVYYHEDSDPCEYNQNVTNTLGQTVAAGSPEYSLDKRSRLLIPTAYMKHLGVNAGDVVYVYKELDSILISKDVRQLSKLNELKVDNHGYLYVASSTLNEANLGSYEKFYVEKSTDGLVVSGK